MGPNGWMMKNSLSPGRTAAQWTQHGGGPVNYLGQGLIVIIVDQCPIAKQANTSIFTYISFQTNRQK